MLSSYTARFVFKIKQKNIPAAWGSEGTIQRYHYLFGASRRYCMPKDKNAQGKRKQRKKYFHVGTEETTLGVCHRLDRKSHYKLTPELEFQLTTSTTRAIALFSADRPPS